MRIAETAGGEMVKSRWQVLLCALAVFVCQGGAGAAHAAPPLPAASPTAEGISAARLERLHRFMQGTIDSETTSVP